jgi:hypothetical protein
MMAGRSAEGKGSERAIPGCGLNGFMLSCFPFHAQRLRAAQSSIHASQGGLPGPFGYSRIGGYGIVPEPPVQREGQPVTEPSYGPHKGKNFPCPPFGGKLIPHGFKEAKIIFVMQPSDRVRSEIFRFTNFSEFSFSNFIDNPVEPFRVLVRRDKFPVVDLSSRIMKGMRLRIIDFHFLNIPNIQV